MPRRSATTRRSRRGRQESETSPIRRPGALSGIFDEALVVGPVSQAIKELPVAAVCDICAKGPGFGHNVPWSKKKTNRRWNPNIQRVRAVVGGTPKRLNVCTSCLKSGKVTR